MNARMLIEGYLAGYDAAAVISYGLEESSVSQLKKQKPWLVPLIDTLKKKVKLDPKYIPWAVAVLGKSKFYRLDAIKKGYNLDPDNALSVMQVIVDDMRRDEKRARLKKLKELANKFEKISKSKKFDKALKLGLLKNKRTKDIMFWVGNVKTELGSGDAVDVLDKVLDRLEGLQSRKDIKTQEADLIYKDSRFTVYSPLSHKASCQLGAGTRWCISSRSDRYFDDYTAEGQAFAFIMDAAGDKDHYKIAVVYSIPEREIEEYYNAPDDSIREQDVEKNVGKGNWSKIKSKIEAYMSKRKVEIERAEGDYWAGDKVEYTQGRTYDLANEVMQNLLNPYRFDHVSSEVLRDRDLEQTIIDAFDEIYSGAYGTITDPVRSNAYKDDNAVSVEGKYGKDTTDWDDVLDTHFPIGPKPVNPLKQPQLLLQFDKKELADRYQDEVNAYLEAKYARKEFKKNIIDIVKGMSGGKWDKEVYLGYLTITSEIATEDAIAEYGLPY